MPTKKKSLAYLAAFDEGTDAVRARPYYSPSNPYDSDEEPDKHEGWEAGATSAGWNDIYTNGVLDKEYRR
jgi:hypothetical protein